MRLLTRIRQKATFLFVSTEDGAIRGAEEPAADASEQGGDEPGQRRNSLIYVGSSSVVRLRIGGGEGESGIILWQPTKPRSRQGN